MAVDPISKGYADTTRANEKKIRTYHPPRNNFVASELGNCKRWVYYRRAGFIPRARTARGDDYGRDGDLHHDQVRRYMKKHGVRMAGLQFNADGTVSETKNATLRVKHEGITFDIGMRLDGFIFLGNRKHVLEIKSMGYWKIKPLQDDWEKNESDASLLAYLEEKRLDIMYQIHACMAATKVNRTYLLIKDRSDCKIGLHSRKNPKAITGGLIIEYRPHIFQNMVRRMATVQRALKSGVPPRPEHLQSSSECMYYCPYRHLCHDAELRRKQGKKPAMVHPQLGDKLHVEDL